jgi:hypothetical protein
MQTPLQIAFKGDRNYLHGTDFFKALDDVAKDFTSGRACFIHQLKLRRLVNKACNVASLPPEDRSLLVGEATLQLEGGGLQNLWLIETGNPITERRPYDEETAFADVLIDIPNRVALLEKGTGFTPIEEIIALTKKLSYALKPDIDGKWLFGQLSIQERLKTGYKVLKIQTTQIVGGRFSINDISIDNRKVGVIHFIVGET